MQNPFSHSIRSLVPRWIALIFSSFTAIVTLHGASTYSTPYKFTTLVGLSTSGSADGTRSNAQFSGPFGVAADITGNLYIADTGNNTIRKMTPAGIVTTVAGLAGSTGSTDGTGNAARFNRPTCVAVDVSGNLYVTDSANNVIRKITPQGAVTTLAGSATDPAGSTDGTGSAARFKQPSGLALDSAGNLIVADTYNLTIRRITPAGVVTTLAGTALSEGSNDGTGAAAQFSTPFSVTVDNSNNVYVADTGNDTIRKITALGVVTTLAGAAGQFGSTDGTGNAARFGIPYAITVDASGNLYVADGLNGTIRKITSAAVVTTLAGTPFASGNANGTGSIASFNAVWGIAIDKAGNLYLADSGNNTVRKGIPPASNKSNFDGDSRDEVLWHNTSSGVVTSWTSSAGFKTFGTEDVNWTSIGRADFDGDGKDEVLWRNQSTAIVASWTSTNGYQVYGTESNGWLAIGTGDFDGDGKDEVLWSNSGTGTVASWTSATGYQVYGNESGGWAVISSCDLDGDGKCDVLWHNTNTGTVAAWTSTAGYRVYGTEGGGWVAVDTGDFDGDHKADVLWRNSNTGIIASWTSTSGYQVYGTEDGNWNALDTGDYDGDGKTDVLWHNSATHAVASWTSSGGYTVFGTETSGWAVISFSISVRIWSFQ